MDVRVDQDGGQLDISYESGYRKANPENRTEMCRRLELKLTTCIAERHAAPEADEHRRCYSKVFLTGLYNGLGHCIPYEEAMKQALRSKGLYPV
ncbi:uncharacterized protein HaLaN_23936, partial [Haematococcus lacustris]